MKHEIRNTKQMQMTKIENSKQYDLEDRTLAFAENVRAFVNKLPKATLILKENEKNLNRKRQNL